MGSSESSSATTQQTTQIDERIGAAEGATVIRLEDGSMLDIEDLSDEAVREVLGFAGGALDTAREFTEGQLAENRKLVEQSLAIAQEASKSEIQTIAQQLIKIGAIVAVATIGGVTLPKVLK